MTSWQYGIRLNAYECAPLVKSQAANYVMSIMTYQQIEEMTGHCNKEDNNCLTVISNKVSV